MNKNYRHSEFLRFVETEVIANIDKAFHLAACEDLNQNESTAACQECAAYLKARLEGYIDAQAALIGQADVSFGTYANYGRFMKKD